MATPETSVGIGMASPGTLKYLDLCARTNITVSHTDLSIKPARALRDYIRSESASGKPPVFPSAMHVMMAMRCKDEESVRRLMNISASFEMYKFHCFEIEFKKKWQKHDSIGAVARAASTHRMCCKHGIAFQNNVHEVDVLRHTQMAIELVLRNSERTKEVRRALLETGNKHIYYMTTSGYSLHQGGRFNKGEFIGRNQFGKMMMDARSRLAHITPVLCDTIANSVLIPSIREIMCDPASLVIRSAPDLAADNFFLSTLYRHLNQRIVGVLKGELCFPNCLCCYADIRGPDWERTGPTRGRTMFCESCDQFVSRAYGGCPPEKRALIEERILTKFISVNRDNLMRWKVYNLDMEDDPTDLESHLASCTSLSPV